MEGGTAGLANGGRDGDERAKIGRHLSLPLPRSLPQMSASKPAKGIVNTILRPLLEWRKKNLGAALANYGLRVDDMIDPHFSKDVAEALQLLPERERVRQYPPPQPIDDDCRRCPT